MALTNSPWWVPFSASYHAVIGCSDSADGIAIGTEGNTILVQNDGTKTAYFLLDADGTANAIAQGTATGGLETSQAILGGAIMSFLIAPSMLFMSAICAAGETTVLRISRGSGQ